jgi:hypothetical protein
VSFLDNAQDAVVGNAVLDEPDHACNELLRSMRLGQRSVLDDWFSKQRCI